MQLGINCDNEREWINSYCTPAATCNESGRLLIANDTFRNEFGYPEYVQRILEESNNESRSVKFNTSGATKNNHFTYQLQPISLNDEPSLLFTFSKTTQPHPVHFQCKKELQALSHSDIGVWTLDPKSQEAFFSDRFKMLIGYRGKQALTWKKFRSFIYEDDIEIFDVFFNDHAEFDIRLKFDFRLAQPDSDDSLRWFLIQGKLCRDTQLISGILRDTSLEKEAFIALTKAGQTNDLALEAGNIGIWSGERDRTGKWHWMWDHRINEMFEFSKYQVGNIDAWKDKIIASDQQLAFGLLDDALTNGHDYKAQYRLQLKNGSIRYVKGIGKVTRNQIGEVHRIDGICYDQTQLRQAHQELHEMNETLEKRVAKRTAELEKARIAAENACEAKGRFLAMMSHELRTPMNGVIGSLDLLQTYEQSYDEMELIETAKTSAVGLVNILNDILDFSKIEAGKLNMIIEDISINKLVDEVISIIMPVATDKNIQLNINESPDLPPVIKSDGVRVKQILFNLLGNALKFTSSNATRHGEVGLDVTVIESNDYTATIEFKITDNGIGIAPETQKKLFTPFTQAEKSTSRQYGGTGIGLTISGQLAEMLGGSILFESTPGEGSIFRFQFTPWLSNVTDNGAIPELFGNTIGIVDLTTSDKSHFGKWQSVLVQEGADIEAVSCVAGEFALDWYDAVLFFCEDAQTQAGSILQIALKLSCSIIVATQKPCRDWGKLTDINIHPLPLSSCTKHKFIREVKRILTRAENNSGVVKKIPDLQKLAVSDAEELNDDNGDILIVEDNLLNQKLIRRQLMQLGLQCKIVSDGVLGYSEWSGNDYRIILTDCHMPNMDGYEMTRKIRSSESRNNDNSHIPIIAITGAAMKGDEELCFNAGMDDFLSKPIQLKDVKRVLEYWYV